MRVPPALAAPVPPTPERQPATPPVSTPRSTAPQSQRTLLSSTFNPLDPAGLLINPAVRLASSLNPMAMQRNLFMGAGAGLDNILGGAGAGLDKLKDLIVPDALAGAIGAGMMGGLPGMGMLWGGSGGGKKKGKGDEDVEGKAEKVREEVDELLAASCPLCEGVVVGLDKPFVKEGEVDRVWQL